MGWSAEVTETTDEATSAFTPWQVLAPGETIVYDVERTDAAPTEDWGIRFQFTSNTSRIPDKPRGDLIFVSTVTKVDSIPISGYYAVRCEVYNGEGGPESVEATVRSRKDGVNF